VRFTLDLDLPDALCVELETEAKRCGMTTPKWAAEQIEAEIASRRLPYVDLGRNGGRPGPRMLRSHEETEMVLIEHRILS
jgi:hypothetical protein